MAKLIAIEWDQNELRLAAGTRHGSLVGIDVLAAASLASETPLSPDEFDVKLTRTLAELVSKHGLHRGETIVAAGRAAVEFRGLSLPPADDNDLPDMVRFAAQRSFAQLGDSWPIDFVKFPGGTSDTIQVLASAMSSTLIAKIQKIVEQAGLTTKSIMLRPLASTALAMAAEPTLRNQASLIVNVVGDEADLLVAQEGVANVIRTVRLPEGNSEQRLKALASEIKRTWLASESQSPALKPTHLVLWGDAGCGNRAGTDLSDSTKLPTTSIQLRKAAQLPNTLPTGDVERFAPVVGMLWQATHGDKHAFDFLNPRRRVDIKIPLWKKLTAAGGVAALVLIGVWWYFSERARLDQEILALTAKSVGLDKTVKTAEGKRADWDKVVEFLRADVHWLDQIAYLSEKAPPADRIYLYGTPLFAMDSQGKGGNITSLSAAAKSQQDLTDANNGLRDAQHAIKPSKINISDTGTYRYVETLQIAIQPKTKSELETLLAAAAKAEKEAPKPSVSPAEKPPVEKPPVEKPLAESAAAEPVAADKAPATTTPEEPAIAEPSPNAEDEASKAKGEGS